MAVFAVFLRGENFVMECDGKAGRYGFYTTRYVRATASETAEVDAVNLIRKDEKLRKSARVNDSGGPMVFAERFELRPWWHIFKTQPGYCFWDMDEEETT